MGLPDEEIMAEVAEELMNMNEEELQHMDGEELDHIEGEDGQACFFFTCEKFTIFSLCLTFPF